MITLRAAASRGQSRMSWLDSRHSFSFGQYYDPANMGWGSLRVINEDIVAGGAGFDAHPHREMEILTWVLSGALAHRDSTGGAHILRAGELQRMSAGTGIVHAEYNADAAAPVHFLQIWLHPGTPGLAPGYEQTRPALPENGLIEIAGPAGGEQRVRIHQDAHLHAARLAAGGTAMHRPAAGRLQWLQLTHGAMAVNGVKLTAGDGAAISGETALHLHSDAGGSGILFDLAG